MVQEDGFIVSALQFDSTGPKSSLCGKMVSVENANIGTQFIDSNFYIRNTIASICAKLSIGSEHLEPALRWYKLCLQYSMSKGKSILYTLSACVYISCRQEGTPHLLIDFSNELRLDMFRIGKVFLKLCSILGVEMPLVDPSLYMHRFVSQLNFRNRAVLDYSVRLLSRMKKDWIAMGRRPNNTCGAALLISSRIFGEEKSIYEIAAAVKASPAIINKRLAEIAATESADLGIEEFKEVWLEVEENPPVIKKSRRIKAPARKTHREPNDSSEYEESFDVDDLILNEEEARRKGRIWDSLYGDYEAEQEGKRRDAPKRAIIRRQRRYDFSTVEEAFMSLDRKVSSKLNYAAIESLFDPSP